MLRERGPARTNVMAGIGLKVASVIVFVAMSAIIKGAEGVPIGQLIFFRSAFALIPVLIFLGFRRELLSGFKTQRFGGHIFRGCIGTTAMFLMFIGLTHLPLPEAITISYATPLFIVIFSAVFLREKIRLFRWSAVVIGLVGVVIIMWPRLTFLSSNAGAPGPQALGALAAFSACMATATAMMTVRNLVRTESSATIVIYFSLVSTAIGLATLPFGWAVLSWQEALILSCAGIAGGLGQILVTESYRHAELTTVAPFEYSSMILSIAAGFLLFGDIPTVEMLVGGIIVTASGIFIIYREHRLGLDRAKSRKVMSPA